MTDIKEIQENIFEALFYFFLFGAFSGALFCIFIQMLIKSKNCAHNNIVTRTFWASTTCEETADFCADCGTQLTEIKMDCR
jgi:hypothetical protein